jgi:type I restriction enzyme S subunit
LADVWQIRDGRREVVTETAEMVSELGLANSSARLLPAGTVILSRTASVGFSAIMGVPMATTQDFANWVCGPQVVPEYLLYVFRAMGAEFSRLKFGSTHSTIYMPDVAKFAMPLPPVEEQREIVDTARARKEKMEALGELARQEAERLREYRSSLISAAVTGQLNIDDFQARRLEAA